MWTWVGGEDISTVSNAECEQRLDKLKEGMVKAFDYSEGERVDCGSCQYLRDPSGLLQRARAADTAGESQRRGGGEQ